MQVLRIALQGIGGKAHAFVIVYILCTSVRVSTIVTRYREFVSNSIRRTGARRYLSSGIVCIRRVHIGQAHPFCVYGVHLDTNRLATVTLIRTAVCGAKRGTATGILLIKYARK